MSIWSSVCLVLLPIGQAQESAVLTDRFQVPTGLEVVRWAESPLFYNPTALDVDVRGRLWVAEAVNYRQWGGRNPGRRHAEGDRIVILEDRDGDGRPDEGRVFVQDPDLVAPLGLAVFEDRVLVSASPYLFAYYDDDGDDRADRREVLLSGFGGFDHDHGLHSVVPGVDGRLLFNVGNAGPHLVTDRSGWALRSGSLYNGGGPAQADNKPGLVSDDGRVWTGGLILACEPDGTGLEVLAHNFRNNYEVAQDSFGNLFQTDNDDDGNQSCRTLFCLEGGDHGYFSADGSRSWQADRRPGQETVRAHWHQDDPGVVPAGCINGGGGPTGLLVYEGELLARWIGGAVINADAGRGVVYAHEPVSEGAGFELRPAVLLAPRPERDDQDARWFRPSDVVVGVGGELYVADWYDPGVGGHAMGDREAYGRILRVAPVGSAASLRDPPPALSGGTTSAVEVAACLEVLRSPALQLREAGRRRLAHDVRQGVQATVSALEEAYRAEPDARYRARLVWAALASGDRRSFESFVKDEHPAVRTAALRALVRAHGTLPLDWESVRGLASDPAAQVRRALLVALRQLPLERWLGLFDALVSGYDGDDRLYLEALGVAVRGSESIAWQRVAEAAPEPEDWDARLASLAWRLHPADLVPAWDTRARSPRKTAAERRQAVDALAFTPGRAAGQAMLLLAMTGTPDVQAQARWWIRHRDANEWRAYGLLEQLGAVGFDDAELLAQSEVLRTGSHAFEVDVSGYSTLLLEVSDGGDGNACDWAVWIDPRFEGGDGRWSLTELPWLEESCQWGQTHVNANCVGDPLFVGERPVPVGLGVHARSRIAYAVPDGARRFVASGAPEAGGTRQNEGRTTSVRFALYGVPDRAAHRRRQAALERTALDVALELPKRREAAAELASDPDGALRWIQRASKGEVPSELEASIAAALFQNADLAVRSLASAHFVRPGEERIAFPSIAELTSLQGDPDKGRLLFRDGHRAQCARCHTFAEGERTVGRDLGPDLTDIRSKFGAPELFDAILNPNAGIAFGYDTWALELVDGALLAGFLLADGERIVLKDTSGVRHVLESDEVVERTRQSVSTMPEGVALGLSPNELADLVAFLRHEPKAPRFGPVRALWNGTDFAGWTWVSRDGRTPVDEVWSAADGVLTCLGTPGGYLRTTERFTDFELSLEWRFDPDRGPGNSGVLLRVQEPDEVWPRSIEAQLQYRNAGDFWNIGRFPMETDPARLTGRRTSRRAPSSEKPVGEWNRYELLVHGPRVELRVNGVLQNTADWCAAWPGYLALQSEGAWIQFRNLELRPILTD